MHFSKNWLFYAHWPVLLKIWNGVKMESISGWSLDKTRQLYRLIAKSIHSTKPLLRDNDDKMILAILY